MTGKMAKWKFECGSIRVVVEADTMDDAMRKAYTKTLGDHSTEMVLGRLFAIIPRVRGRYRMKNGTFGLPTYWLEMNGEKEAAAFLRALHDYRRHGGTPPPREMRLADGRRLVAMEDDG